MPAGRAVWRDTVASVFYYLRWIFPLFQRRTEATGETISGPRPDAETIGVWSVRVAIMLGVVSLAMGLAANPLLRFLEMGSAGR